MSKPADIVGWVAVTVAACAATVLLFVLFAPALIATGIAALLIGIAKRTTRMGRVVIVIGVIWFALGFTTSTFLLATGTKGVGGKPVRAQAPVRRA